MPLINSTYNPPLLFKNGHFSTIYSGKIRRVVGVEQKRKTIPTPDGDFIDLDWSYSQKKTHRLAIILHGLEGNAQRPYITGSAKLFNINGLDVVSLNYRGCSGKSNKKYRSYHSGDSEELAWIIKYLIDEYDYNQIFLKGFSLGANVALKYLGEHQIPSEVKAAIAVSAPCDLYGSMLEIHKKKNYLYALRFKRSLLAKLKEKQKLFPDKIRDEDVKKIISLKDFDDFYTSQAHGFANALDYYEKSSSLQFLPHITIPTLILNAENDSFLSKSCYPFKQAKENKFLFLEVPKYGGHVGFYDSNNIYYNEKKAIEFLNSL
ncbi:YheT family hydrolase [Galbibacter mesophilus]|uniref:YheT family hydrolase n=1 Tax=Galbibacter mesophilus TaxID=379069 RepID=UPI00191D56EC|nr:alpha/beta fold hydrolase [Galbibacter mesophilus]MCM5662068.1 alpha/beta fold hydrolase [Galbibacter mesophilus]